MLKLTTITFALIAALSFAATTAQAGTFTGNRAPQPTSVDVLHCNGGKIWKGRCFGPGPQIGGLCDTHHPCPTPVDPATDCAGPSKTIYGTTHECR